MRLTGSTVCSASAGPLRFQAVRAEAEALLEKARTEARAWERKARESAAAAVSADQQRREAERRLAAEQERSRGLDAELAELRLLLGSKPAAWGSEGVKEGVALGGDAFANWLWCQREAWATRGDAEAP